jgi:cyanophycinase
MGIVVLQGGGPFVSNDELDRRLLSPLDGPIAVLLTAEAFENPDELKASARAWAERLGLSIVFCDVFTRADAREEHHARAISTSAAVVLAGDSSIHLRSTLLNTAVWGAVSQLAESGVVVGVGNCAAALCDPMIDPRGGAFGLGLGLITELAAIVEVEQWTEERLKRTRQLATGPLAEIPTGSAMIRDGSRWTVMGDVAVRGFQVDSFL